jgi:Trk K+ transport system NAD-binding subunit
MEAPVILCGLGKVGWRVLEYLRKADLPVVVIDATVKPGDPRLEGVRYIRGDCRQRETLEEAGLANARGVLVLTSEDLVNISATLTIRHLHPTVRIVVRMFNQNIIPRLAKAIPNVFALSTSALAAPLLALTALTGDALGTFQVDGQRRQVAELTVSDNSPLRGRRIGEVVERHGVLVLAHLPFQGRRENWDAWDKVDKGGSGGQNFPSLTLRSVPTEGGERLLLEVVPETRLATGDRLVLCGEPRSLALLLAQVRDEALPGLLWASKLRRWGRVVWRSFGEMDMPVKICTGVFVFVILCSTLVFYFGMDLSLHKALFRTISVMATGADMHEQEVVVEPWRAVFVSTMRILGAALMGLFTALITNYFLRARLSGALEVRSIPDGGHVVVCGLGRVGFRVVEELLKEGERVVAIEQSRDNRFLPTTRRLGVPVILGEATVPEVLQQANAATARAVITATSNELANLEMALLARELNPKQRVVLRMTDPHLARTLREAANVRLALSIPALAAPAFLAGLYGDRVHSIFLVGGRLLAVVEVVIAEDDSLLGDRPLREVAMDYHFLPVYLVGSDRTAKPQPLTQRLTAGDRVTLIAAVPDLDRLFRRTAAR